MVQVLVYCLFCIQISSVTFGTMQYLMPKDGFDIMFIRYFFQGINFSQYKQGATIPHIYFKDYKSELVPNQNSNYRAKNCSRNRSFIC